MLPFLKTLKALPPKQVYEAYWKKGKHKKNPIFNLDGKDFKLKISKRMINLDKGRELTQTSCATGK